jgi:hypothetical protein
VSIKQALVSCTDASMLCSLLEFRQDWLYFRKCSRISLRQVRRDLIAGCQGVTEQVAECWVLRANRNLLSLPQLARHHFDVRKIYPQNPCWCEDP